MRLNVCFNYIVPFGPFSALLSIAAVVAVMAEMEVSPQEEMANPQRMKVFAVERHGLPEDFVYFSALCGVQSSPLVFVMNRHIVWGPLQVVGTGRVLCASGLRSPELSAQVRRVYSCTSCKPAHTDASITHTPEDFVYFSALCGVQSSPLVFMMNLQVVWGPLQVVGTGRVLCASGLRSPELSAQVRRVYSCTSCKPAHTDASITHTGRNG